MSDRLEQLHARAGLDLLDAVVTVYEDVVPVDASLPYVFVFTNVSWPRDGAGNTLTNLAVTVNTTWTVHCVAESAAAARAVQALVRGALLNQRPTIPGRSCGYIKQDETTDPEPDESTGRLRMDAVSVFSLISTP